MVAIFLVNFNQKCKNSDQNHQLIFSFTNYKWKLKFYSSSS